MFSLFLFLGFSIFLLPSRISACELVNLSCQSDNSLKKYTNAVLQGNSVYQMIPEGVNGKLLLCPILFFLSL